MNILVTGGAGYIGSHTILELLAKNYNQIFSIDNHINSDSSNYDKIENISGKKIKHKNIDLKNLEQLNTFFSRNKIDTVIHFAALKSVPDSVNKPLEYHINNIGGLTTLLKAMEIASVKNIIFSSSCSVYGNPAKLPVIETTPFGEAESPYARTKQIGEMILEDYCKATPGFNAISLRYFNPVGAHKSGLIGEGFTKKPNNLVPIITQVAAGLRDKLTVFGDDYNSKDGSCVRDYIHVEDIAEAHVLALNLFNNSSTKNYEVINLGTGKGTSVFEMISSFEKVSGVKLNYTIGNRRVGDVEIIYANNAYAKEYLKWNPKHDIDSMMKSAWKWQQAMKV